MGERSESTGKEGARFCGSWLDILWGREWREATPFRSKESGWLELKGRERCPQCLNRGSSTLMQNGLSQNLHWKPLGWEAKELKSLKEYKSYNEEGPQAGNQAADGRK